MHSFSRTGAAVMLAAATTVCVLVAVPAGAAVSPQTFSYTGDTQTFTVPAGVCTVSFDAIGGHGGDSSGGAGVGAQGGEATGTIAVTPGEVLQINVGGPGTNGVTHGAPGSGGFNGGAIGGAAVSLFGEGGDAFPGGGGGGATDIRQGGPSLAEPRGRCRRRWWRRRLGHRAVPAVRAVV